MNAGEAFQKDKRGDFYADWDDEAGAYGVFGTESGFCYATFSDKGDAEDQAVRLRARAKR